MALLSLRTLGCAALVLTCGAGCASEEWDNPRDPEAAGYRAPCAGAPAEEQEGCVFWEEFDHGLTRWRTASAAVRIVPSDPGGKVATVLALPACSEEATVEIDFPSAEVVLEVEWQGPASLQAAIDRKSVGAIESPAETAGWRESFATVHGTPGTTALLSLWAEKTDACSGVGVYVSRVALKKALD